MNSEPELKYYTIADLRQWLLHNKPIEGLSDKIIAPQRAYAIMNNPYVKDSDAVISAIFEDEEPAAYTAAFPDMLNKKRIWWLTTLWCNPKFQGHGYGLIVVGSLIDAHKPEHTYDRWSANETIEICNYLGMRTVYSSRYYLGDKAINRDSIKGKIAYYAQLFTKMVKRVPLPCNIYTLKYISFVDGEAYDFICSHRGNDLFLREQKMLNWILQYPFLQSSYILNKVEKNTSFSSNTESYKYVVVKVYQDNKLVGVYMLREDTSLLAVVFIYYTNREVVFESVAEHFIKMSSSGIFTEDIELVNYLRKFIYFPCIHEHHVSFSMPSEFDLPNDYKFQLIDGDSFA